MIEQSGQDVLLIDGSGFISGTLAPRAISQGPCLGRDARATCGAAARDACNRQSQGRAACDAAIGAPKQRFDLVVDVIGREADDARQDVELFRDQASQLVFVSLVTQEIGLRDALNETPGWVPFPCHRIYDPGWLREYGLTVPSTPIEDRLHGHVACLLETAGKGASLHRDGDGGVEQFARLFARCLRHVFTGEHLCQFVDP